jgi:hypothetical protein
MLVQAPSGTLYHRAEPRRVPYTDSPDPAREAHLELLLRDPAAARRQRLEARVRYWRQRVERLQARADALQELLADAELGDKLPAIDLWRGRVELLVAQADALEASRRLADVEHAARAAGLRLAPFRLEDSPVPEPLPVETGPRRPGPKITCECGTCARCKAREAMRRRRAEQKAAKAR